MWSKKQTEIDLDETLINHFQHPFLRDELQIILFLAKEKGPVLLANSLNRTRLTLKELCQLLTASRRHGYRASLFKMQDNDMIWDNTLVLSRFEVASLYAQIKDAQHKWLNSPRQTGWIMQSKDREWTKCLTKRQSDWSHQSQTDSWLKIRKIL